MEVKRFGGNGRMSQAVVHNGVLYLAGQTSRDGGSVAEQTEAVLKKIEKLLSEHGSDKNHMLRANIYLRDIKDFAEMNKVWDAWVTPGSEPARACVEARLAAETIAVEIVVTAAIA